MCQKRTVKSPEQNGSNGHECSWGDLGTSVPALYKWWGLSWSVVRKPDCRVSLILGIEPTNTGEMKEIVPFGVHATRNLAVLWCLYWLHVKDCLHRSEAASKKKKKFHLHRWWQKYSGTILLNERGRVYLSLDSHKESCLSCWGGDKKKTTPSINVLQYLAKFQSKKRGLSASDLVLVWQEWEKAR